MEHIRDRATRGHRIHRNLLVAAVFRQHAHEGLNRALGARVQRVFRHAEVLGRVGRHQDNTAALVEMAVGFAGNEVLSAGVDAEDAIEFFLF